MNAPQKLFNLCLAVCVLFGCRQAMATDFEPLPRTAAKPGDTAEKIALGKKLFFDPRLSATGTVSCNGCHNLMEGGDDGRATSMGVSGLTGPRNAPTVWNSVFQASQFWDGRAATLEEQAKGPMVADVEMGMVGHDQVIGRIEKIPGYVEEFGGAFGESEAVTIENAVEAIAAFERTLITPDSPFDRFLAGDQSAINEQAIRGMELFESIGCTECHSGPALNNWTGADDDAEFVEFPRFIDSPLVDHYDLGSDLGRLQVTNHDGDERQFKVPVLRNITLTAPYMHNGKVASLSEACRVMASTQLDEELTDKQVSDLIAFMATLEGDFPEIALPRLPSRVGESVIDPSSVSDN
ncbi:cytochrome c peroxidase [Neorhodopirellula lusitana]|uniref:Cytochrome c peroxidase n=1 Tax=Neorhodopirellula lusitana TaxID=445327 RepID=A0ABY1Q4N6_9BACT|nr:cytochrome c peroxidase [Neorhodopirellula lusitana]SMP59589.1 cytochrome c peroxidase [Neorhodopirellula lusitana]